MVSVVQIESPVLVVALTVDVVQFSLIIFRTIPIKLLVHLSFPSVITEINNPLISPE